MSRVGKAPIPVPGDVKVTVADGRVAVEKKGTKLELSYHPNMLVKFDAGAKAITVARPDDERQNRALHGLTRSLINNMVVGVATGFEKKLKIEGLGYQARMDGKSIVLSVGYANQITLTPPDGVTVALLDKEGTQISVKGRTSRRSASSRPRSGPPGSRSRTRARASGTRPRWSGGRKASRSPVAGKPLAA